MTRTIVAIDKDVHAKIESMKRPSQKRRGEKESANDVLRRVFHLD